MVTILISSTEDIASTNIKKEILSITDWEKSDTFCNIPVFKHQSWNDLYLITINDQSIFHEDLVEQIYDELFANIEKHGEFDEGTIKGLEQLAVKGELKKHRKVVGVIKVTAAKEDETTGTGN